MSDKLATQGTTALAVPDYIGSSRAGLENVGKDEISFPRISIAQDTSPAVKKSSGSEYIAGCEPGDLFNTLTRDIYQRPLRVVPILFFHSYIKFRPQDQGGGVLRMADTAEGINPADLKFGPNGEKPVWTTLWNFLVYLPEQQEVAVVSMKSTSAKIAKQWNSLLTLFGSKPAFARSYVLATEVEDKGANSYYNYSKVKSTGFVSKEEYETCEQLYKQFSGKTIQVEDSSDPETEVSPF
jgi:hypothetical protein